MDNQFRDESIFSLEVSPIMRSDLAETIKWGKFLAIMGFIGTGFMILAGIGMGTLSGQLGNSNGLGALMGIGGTFVYFAIAALYFYPAFAMYKFCILTKQGLLANNQGVFEEGFSYLKRLLRYMGILTIVVLSFYVLVLVVVVLAKI